MKEMTLWRAKLAAWTHDPAEKALVLLRDPAGHEWGTAAQLREKIFGQRTIPSHLKKAVEQADHWASAADRPQWPRGQQDGRYPAWTQVRFTEKPVLIHPLSGQKFDLRNLADISVETIKAKSLQHFEGLIDAENDARKTALAFWRFGPVMYDDDDGDIGEFWGLLPADTRVPDHTIWQHLDLTSAFATAFHADENDNPALLTLSFGPVQGFIAQARTTSDLWAGSHLLSRIAWEGLKLICAEYGPDAVIFPQLRGIPQVDLWLRDEMKLPQDLFKNEEWRTGATDSNPLFAAALPNRFVALVPASAAAGLAERITVKVRDWVMAKGREALECLLNKAGISDAPAAFAQIEAQLAGFPETHWAVAPWRPLIGASGAAPDTGKLCETLKMFHGEGAKSGFLHSSAWTLLSRDLIVEGQRFYSPNAGVLYPALYDLLDRTQAAAKSVREFDQLPQEGYRCSLCGEREWLTQRREHLSLPPGKRGDAGTLWERVRLQGASWARKGEHLCAPCSLKRLWPELYCEEIAKAFDGDQRPTRFVVSTHTMAIATSLERWLEQPGPERKSLPAEWNSQLQELSNPRRTVALPRKLAKHVTDGQKERAMLRGLPLFLEDRNEQRQSDELEEREQAAALTENLDSELKEIFGAKPEAYYAMILMDGDRMGAWLSGQGEYGEKYRLPFEKTWHPQLRHTLGERYPTGDLADYLSEKRPVSPARHMAISSSLNAFALHVARHVVEDTGKGKLIYAGGDDVLAMVSVDDLLKTMFLLRLAYSGLFPIKCEHNNKARTLLGLSSGQFDLRRGHVMLKDRLYRMMGSQATASTGAVVAHHQAPLGAVLRELHEAEQRAKKDGGRDAEQRAKKDGGRDAFAISLLKRSGGAVRLTCPWLAGEPGAPANWRKAMLDNLEETPMGQLIRLRNRFAGNAFSRRAAYLTQGWLTDIPETALSAMLGYQFKRQTGGDETDKQVAESSGQALGKLALAVHAGNSPNDARPLESRAKPFVEDFLTVAEFLAREGRTEHPNGGK